MLTLGALLLGLARADAQNRLFVPLPGARAASFRSGQRVPVGQAVYMHHGVDHDHDWGFVARAELMMGWGRVVGCWYRVRGVSVLRKMIFFRCGVPDASKF